MMEKLRSAIIESTKWQNLKQVTNRIILQFR